MRLVLLIILLLLLIGSLPVYPYSTNWGFYPSGGFVVILVIVLLLLFRGY